MNESEPDINKVLFMHLVSMLAMSAIQQMGKLADPSTGKAETNLEAAQATIDMLDMIEAKTRGNLDAEEAKLLKNTIMSLKMNYVESQDRKAEGGRQTPDARRRTAEDGDKKAEGGRQTPDTRRQTSEDGDKKAEGGRQTPDTRGQTSEDGDKKAEDQKSDTRQQTSDAGPENAGNEDKTPKYHKKYE